MKGTYFIFICNEYIKRHYFYQSLVVCHIIFLKIKIWIWREARVKFEFFLHLNAQHYTISGVKIYNTLVKEFTDCNAIEFIQKASIANSVLMCILWIITLTIKIDKSESIHLIDS